MKIVTTVRTKTTRLEIRQQRTREDAARRRQELDELFREAQQAATPNIQPRNWSRFFNV